MSKRKRTGDESKSQQRYDVAFKQRAVEMANNSQLSFKTIAKQLGVSAETLRRWRSEHDERVFRDKAYELEMSDKDGWKFDLTETVLSGRCATQPPYPGWSVIGREFAATVNGSMWVIAVIVALFSVFVIVSPFVLPAGHNESFGNWAALVTFGKTLIALVAIALGIVAASWIIEHEHTATVMTLGIFGVTLLPVTYYLTGVDENYGGFLQVLAIINTVILGMALVIGVVMAIWMLFRRLVISYEFNVATSSFKCVDATLLRRPREHIIPFALLSSVQIHQHEEYSFTKKGRYNKFRGQIKCVDLSGNSYVIGNFREDLPEKSLLIHEEWLRRVFGEKILQVEYHSRPD